MSLKNRIKNKFPVAYKNIKCVLCFPKKIKKYIKSELYYIIHLKEIIYADIVLSIGDNCQAAYYMKEYDLRKFASPIDWMTGYSLETLFNLFKNDFRDFFSSYYEDYSRSKEIVTRFVIDKHNGMIAMHHFHKNSQIEQQFSNFLSKTFKRWQKIKNYLSLANNIVFISHRNDRLEDLEKFLFNFSTLYDVNLTILNFRDNKNNEYKKIYNINKKLKIVEFCFDDKFPPNDRLLIKNPGIVWIGNYKKWGGGMRLIKLSNKIDFNNKKEDVWI